MTAQMASPTSRPNRNSSPMRVLHIGKFYPPDRGGMESHLETLCHGLRHSVNLEVVVSSKSRAGSRAVLGGIPVRRLATPITLASAPINPSMVSAIRESDCDLVHLHHPNPMGMLALLASGNRKPLVVTYHSDIVRQRVLGTLIQPLLTASFERAAAIIATSPNYIEGSTILQRYRSRTHVIPLGIHLEPFDRDFSAQAAQIRAGYPDRPLIVAIGRCVYYKGFQYLVRAMENVDAQLLIIGDGPMRQELSALAASVGAASRVAILGEVEEVQPYLEACDIFAFPSIARSEAFGIVQLEAMACRKPVVNTSLNSGVPYVSLDGETGITVPPEDSQAFGDALRKLVQNPDLRIHLGANGRRRLEAEFTADRMVERTAELYRRVLSA